MCTTFLLLFTYWASTRLDLKKNEKEPLFKNLIHLTIYILFVFYWLVSNASNVKKNFNSYRLPFLLQKRQRKNVERSRVYETRFCPLSSGSAVVFAPKTFLIPNKNKTKYLPGPTIKYNIYHRVGGDDGNIETIYVKKKTPFSVVFFYFSLPIYTYIIFTPRRLRA